MRRFFLFMIVLLMPNLIAAQNTGPQNITTVRYGVSPKSFETINHSDAVAALKAWSTAIVREQGLDEKIEVTLFQSFDELRRALRDHKLEAIAVTLEEAVYLDLKPDSIYMPIQELESPTRYVLLTHSGSDIAEPSDLTDRVIATSAEIRMVLARPWFDMVMAESAGQLTDRWMTNLNVIRGNPSKAIFQVFFGKADAALVTREVFELACELNPQLGHDITVLAVSPPFMTRFMMFLPSFKGPSRERFETAMLTLHTTPGGRQVLTVFQGSQLTRQSPAILDDTRRFLERYHKMLRKRTP